VRKILGSPESTPGVSKQNFWGNLRFFRLAESTSIVADHWISRYNLTLPLGTFIEMLNSVFLDGIFIITVLSPFFNGGLNSFRAY